MKVETLYTLGESTIDYDPSVPCIVAKQVGFLDSNEFRDLLNKGLELMIEKRRIHGKMAWVPDLRKGDAQTNEDLEWVGTDWNARALAAGINHVAFVLPDDEYALTAMNANTFKEVSESEKSDKQMITCMFKDEDSAKEWLRGVLNG